MSKSEAYTNGAFMAFGIAIGYASNFVPEQNLWLLTVGLSACAVVYFAIAWYRHQLNRDYGLQILLLVIAAIAPLTSRFLSAIWVVVFVALGCIGTILNLKAKD